MPAPKLWMPRSQILVPRPSLFPPGAERDYIEKVKHICGASLIALWVPDALHGTRLIDYSGNNFHGTHTGVLLGQPGIGDARTSAYYDGATAYSNVYSAALAAAFNPLEGTLLAWSKAASAGMWTDGAVRNPVSFRVDGNNRVEFSKSGDNQMSLVYVANGTLNNSIITMSDTGWFHLALTWNKAADRVSGYKNGSQNEATLTGLGVWVGSLASTTTMIGALSASLRFWLGNLAYIVLCNRARMPAEIAELSRV